MTHDIILISVTIVGVLVVVALAVAMLPRLLKEKEPPQRITEMDMMLTSFQALGSEMKSLREQLLLKERLAALGEVSAGIAHEFRNPMGVITGYGRLLEKSFPGDDDRRELVEGILREIEGMNRVMDELLSFSRQEPIQKVRISAHDFLADVPGMFSETGDVQIQCNADTDLIADITLLRQAIKNLVQNAFEAGAVQVRIIAYPCKQGVSAGSCLEISDNGPGLAPDALAKIFTPFYTTKPDGTGIGLALVQKIILAHGGSISVESAKGSGTLFRIMLNDPDAKGGI